MVCHGVCLCVRDIHCVMVCHGVCLRVRVIQCAMVSTDLKEGLEQDAEDVGPEQSSFHLHLSVLLDAVLHLRSHKTRQGTA